jgi:peroxiredoxin
MMAVDSVNLGADSTFQFSVEVEEPGFYRLNFYDNQYVTLVLDDEDVVVTADGNNSQGMAEVAGSADTDYFYAVEEMMMELQAGVNNLNQEYIEARSTNNKEGMQAVEQKYDSMETALRAKLKEQIRDMGTSITALYAVNYLDADRDFEFLAELAEKFRQEAPNSQYTQDFVTNVEDMRVLAIGREAPEIALPNPQGDTIALSSLQGKYVLIDFWAAWCRPCRMENPNVVRMYEKYKDKGFEIYGVSLDRTKDAWVDAIQADNLTWMHVSDLKYFNSVAAELYNIQAIPATYLLDKEGKIIAKNLRGKALEDKLEEIFGV